MNTCARRSLAPVQKHILYVFIVLNVDAVFITVNVSQLESPLTNLEVCKSRKLSVDTTAEVSSSGSLNLFLFLEKIASPSYEIKANNSLGPSQMVLRLVVFAALVPSWRHGSGVSSSLASSG